MKMLIGGKTVEIREDIVTAAPVIVALAKTIDAKIQPGFFKAFQAHLEHVYRAAEDTDVINIIENASVISMANFFCTQVEKAELEGVYGRFSDHQDE